jgi:threonine dehydrogenase-like Zn-dependent dehydrogenase
MRALRFDDNTLRLDDIAPPQRSGEALIRLLVAGICSTDLEIVRGYAGFAGTLGHEFVGVVESCEDPSWIGQRVVGEINIGCAVCDVCRNEDARHCPSRTTLGIRSRDGAFAEYLSLPAENLRAVPANVPDRQAVFTEPLAAACEILDQVAITPRDRVAVIGDGKLGQLIARVLATTGCELTLIGKHENKLALAAQAGIHAVLLRDLKTGRFDRIVEATGSNHGLQLAINLVRPRGTVLMKSTIHGNVSLDTSKVVVNEINLTGSRCGRFEPALDLLARGAIDVEPLITREFPLSYGVEAMEMAGKAGILKILLRA